MLEDLIRTPQKFLEFLMQNRGEIVGITMNASQCPIANFIRSNRNDDMQIYVSCSRIAVYGAFFENFPNEVVKSPDWVAVFIDTVDEIGRTPDNICRVEVTAEQCIEILGSLIPDVVEVPAEQAEVEELNAVIGLGV